jgi:uncharacterized protein YjiS (DUF1127 family)
MSTLVSHLARAARQHLAYRRTVAELESLPLDVALDLDLYPGDADRIARHAVYGRAA